MEVVQHKKIKTLRSFQSPSRQETLRVPVWGTSVSGAHRVAYLYTESCEQEARSSFGLEVCCRTAVVRIFRTPLDRLWSNTGSTVERRRRRWTKVALLDMSFGGGRTIIVQQVGRRSIVYLRKTRKSLGTDGTWIHSTGLRTASLSPFSLYI